MARLMSIAVVVLLVASCGPADPPVVEPLVADHRAAGPLAQVVAADGTPIACSVTGDGEVAVVLIHGWMCDRAYWKGQVPVLAERYRVVAVDLPGHGESGRARSLWTVHGFGDDVRAVIEQLGLERVILVGHSMGGPVALVAARLLPGRVAGVVGVDTFHNVEAKVDPAQWEQIVGAMESDFPAACGQFVRSMFPTGADRSLVESTAVDMCGGPPEVGVALLRDFAAVDVAADLRAAGVPVRSVNCDLFPTDVEANRRHGDYDATIMTGVGHFLMLERPGDFADELLAVVDSLVASVDSTTAYRAAP